MVRSVIDTRPTGTFSGHSIRVGAAALALVIAAGHAGARQPAQLGVNRDGARATETTVTVYSSAEPGAVPPELYRPSMRNQWYQPQPVPGYGMVRQIRELEFASQTPVVKVTDVAALIDPTTVSFEPLGADTTTRVLEQNFQFDLVSRDKLLERFIDRPVEVAVKVGDAVQTVRGTLLSTSGGLILRGEDGAVQVLNDYAGLRLAPDANGVPEKGLITKPTLVWNVATEKPGRERVRIGYETQGMTWWADYNLLFAPDRADANKGTIDLSAWVSILNQSGATYEDAKLKLVAGQVNRAPQSQRRGGEMYARRELAMAVAEDAGFEQKSFFEYHMYTLGRATTLPDNSTKQIELFAPVRKVPAQKVLVYDGQQAEWWGGLQLDQGFGAQSKPDVDVYLRLKNDKESGLGIPLPAGRVRVSQLDEGSTKRGEKADATPEFVGEDVIRHTPQGEQVLIKVGKAFDVVGERRQAEFNVDSGRKTMTETIEIKVRNRKQERVSVIVQERMLRWINWEFLGEAPEHTKEDVRTVHFPLTLDPDQEGVVRFTVRYTW